MRVLEDGQTGKGSGNAGREWECCKMAGWIRGCAWGVGVWEGNGSVGGWPESEVYGNKIGVLLGWPDG